MGRKRVRQSSFQGFYPTFWIVQRELHEQFRACQRRKHFFYFQCSVTQIGFKSYQTVLHKKNNG
jgi:hypothetical protein